MSTKHKTANNGGFMFGDENYFWVNAKVWKID